MNGCKEVKETDGETGIADIPPTAEESMAKGMTVDEALEAKALMSYGHYYLGFYDAKDRWEGTECVELVATCAVHAHAFAGRSQDELRGRVGAVLDAIAPLPCQLGLELFVNLAAVAGKPAPQIKVALVKSARGNGIYLVFLLPDETGQRSA
jgi:hypothetical protein